MLKLQTLLLAALLGSLSSCHAVQTDSESGAPADPLLSVVSFNIRNGKANDGENHWEKRKQHVVSTIRANKPDLLGLQEAYDFQVIYLSQNLPQYDVVGVGRNGGQSGEYSCLLLDRRRFEVLRSDTFWLSEEPGVIASKGWDAALPRICTWAVLRDRENQREFLWMNTHFDHRGKLARERSGALLHGHLAGFKGLPAIITGDLNADEHSAPLVATKGDRLRDSFRLVHPEATEVGTFNGFRGSRGGRKIDYVLCSPEWQVLDASIDRREFQGRTPSDHYPVSALLRL